MSPITFGGKPIAGTRAPSARNRTGDEALVQRPVPELYRAPKDNEPVLLFLRLVALSLEAREQLAETVDALREIDMTALDDPALQDHPRRPAMLQELADRQRDEELAVIRLAEVNSKLAVQWDAISPQDKNRYRLTTLVGEPDPQYHIGYRLWCDNTGLALHVPLPENWTVPTHIAHRIEDEPTEGITTHERDELLHSDVAGF